MSGRGEQCILTDLQEVEKECMDFSDPGRDEDTQLPGGGGAWGLEELDIGRSELQFVVPGVESTHDLQRRVIQLEDDSVRQSLQQRLSWRREREREREREGL